jgi:hypothetical protein
LVRVQILLLWAGLALLSVGASIVVLERRAIRSGVAASGRIAGWSERRGDSAPMYHAVIEFVDLRGRKRLTESSLGSGVPIGRVGDAVRVALYPADPDRAAVESRLTCVVGGFVALMGAVSCGVFFATFRADLLSVAASVVVTGIAGFKLHALRARMPQKLPSWKTIRDQAISSRTIDPGAGGEIPWANAETVAAALRRQERVSRVAAPLLVTAGAGLVLLAGHLQKTTSEFLARAVPATGHVVDLLANTSSDGTTYAAMVEFEASGGHHRFKDSLAANPPVYRAGDEVPIRYLPEEPGVARIDRGIWSRLLPAGVGLFGALLALAGLRLGARLLLQARTATA